MRESGFFTLGVPPEGYRLPHPRLGIPVVMLIRRVLCRAFAILREGEFNLAEAKEDEITAALRSIVENNLRQTGVVPGFNRRSYESVVRQGQVANFDRTRLSKSPDLCFRLRHDDSEPRMTLSEFDALFVECKRVDDTGYRSVDDWYCDDGLMRFIIGDYSWAMQEGMMLAYVQTGRTIAKHLIPAMSEQSRLISLATIRLPQPYLPSDVVETVGEAESLHISEHRRDFSWPDAKGHATNITIYHLWHKCG